MVALIRQSYISVPVATLWTLIKNVFLDLTLKQWIQNNCNFWTIFCPLVPIVSVFLLLFLIVFLYRSDLISCIRVEIFHTYMRWMLKYTSELWMYVLLCDCVVCRHNPVHAHSMVWLEWLQCDLREGSEDTAAHAQIPRGAGRVYRGVGTGGEVHAARVP